MNLAAQFTNNKKKTVTFRRLPEKNLGFLITIEFSVHYSTEYGKNISLPINIFLPARNSRKKY